MEAAKESTPDRRPRTAMRKMLAGDFASALDVGVLKIPEAIMSGGRCVLGHEVLLVDEEDRDQCSTPIWLANLA
jgi:hypothetical protein